MGSFDWMPYDEVLWAHMRFLEGQARRGILPECAMGGQCYDCPLESEIECGVVLDADFLALLGYYCSIHLANEQLNQNRVNAVSSVLKRHKLAMHWELVARIVKEEEPDLFSTDRSVLSVLVKNPQRFFKDTQGSYFLAPTSDA